MKLIVEIPADDYEYIKRLNAGYTDYRTTLKLYDAVRNGKPIPLGYTIGLAGGFDKTIEEIRKEIKEWYWQADKQALAKDPCVVDAMVDLFIRTIDKHIGKGAE